MIKDFIIPVRLLALIDNTKPSNENESLTPSDIWIISFLFFLKYGMLLYIALWLPIGKAIISNGSKLLVI